MSYLFVVALMGILITGLSIIGDHYGFAQNIAKLSFLSIFLGTLFYLIRLK